MLSIILIVAGVASFGASFLIKKPSLAQKLTRWGGIVAFILGLIWTFWIYAENKKAFEEAAAINPQVATAPSITELVTRGSGEQVKQQAMDAQKDRTGATKAI